MGLPSNVKKVYLIQLINTKNYCSPRELDQLVHQIRGEQQHRAFARKMTPRNRKRKNEHQSPEITSTNHGLSPPISKTPKRTRHVYIQYHPEMHSPMKYPQTVSARRLPVSSSDRVLRSSNRVTKPSYLLNNTLLSLLKGPDSDKRSETRIKTVSSDESKKRATSRIFAKKIIESWQDEGKLASVSESEDTSPPLGKRARRLSGVYPLQSEDIKLPNVAVRRADGSISKLRAIIQKPLSQQNCYDRTTQTENMNRSLLRANATPPVISTQNSSYGPSNNREMQSNLNYRPALMSNIIVTLPNLDQITSNFTNRSLMMSTTPNLSVTNAICNIYRTSNVTEVSVINSNITKVAAMGIRQYNIRLSSSSDETTLSTSSIDGTLQNGEYYHKKIRAEQVRFSRRSREISQPALVENECRLPRISEVFSKFNGVYSGNVTRPLYVQVDNEPAIAPNPTHIPDPRCQYPGSTTLETLYNLKMPYQPVLQICATTTNTRTVYCTPVISTAKAQPSSTAAVHSVYNVASPPHENQQFYPNTYGVVPQAYPHEAVPPGNYEVVPRADNFFSNFHYHEQINNNNADTPTIDFQRSCSSVETVTSQEQELGANITIPEMVEDALEIISQDGDYMERMGMDIRMQCILCNWAGPKIILEYHIRKDHPKDIVECQSNEFNALYTLGGLWARRLWQSHVLQLGGALYVLSAKYDDPDCFMAALSVSSWLHTMYTLGGLWARRLWQSHVLQLGGALYVLSAKYDDPDCFMAALSVSSWLHTMYTLGGLWARRLWQSHVLQLGGALYVLSAKYDDPDCFMAALSTVSYDPYDAKTGSLTIYNKVTGEPFTWTGLVSDLPPSMPYESDPNCFRLQLSKMDLLPNSANLKLLNRELVTNSPTKVIVGQPELDNIHINLTVKIFD
ncbi:hypothetical protein PYW07_010418 [Mythimna separata]|uniref:Uncharacterized protein n=1 Tax=Mythimna separata TaxID=271217 RepID=A0AAD7YA57_MYTSE|nr:hypothetical protein PYW07_010418 [Mythimna separata]